MAAVLFRVSGLTAFDVECGPATAVRDVKKLLAEEYDIEAGHMRLSYDGKL